MDEVQGVNGRVQEKIKINVVKVVTHNCYYIDFDYYFLKLAFFSSRFAGKVSCSLSTIKKSSTSRVPKLRPKRQINSQQRERSGSMLQKILCSHEKNAPVAHFFIFHTFGPNINS
jgi:hypothetical protein